VTHAGVVEARPGGIDPQEIDARVVIKADRRGLPLAVVGDAVDGHGRSEVEVATLEGVHLGRFVVDGEEMDALQPDPPRVPVVGIAFHPDPHVGTPLDEAEWAVADKLPGPPRLAHISRPPRLDVGTVNGQEGVVGEDLEEVRRGLREAHDKGVRIGREKAHRRPRPFPAMVGLGTLHDVEPVRVLTGEAGLERPAPGEDEIVRGDGVAVAPARLGPQVKGPGAAVRIEFPSRGHAGDDGLIVRRARRDKALDQRPQDAHLGDAGDGLRIEVARFRPVVHQQDAQVVGLRHLQPLAPRVVPASTATAQPR
jgi:hypothetical protein